MIAEVAREHHNAYTRGTTLGIIAACALVALIIIAVKTLIARRSGHRHSRNNQLTPHRLATRGGDDRIVGHSPHPANSARNVTAGSARGSGRPLRRSESRTVVIGNVEFTRPRR